MSTHDLPPLPEPAIHVNGPFGLTALPHFTEDQLRTYAAQAVAQAVERCAALCEEVESQAWALWKTTADPIEQGRNIGAQHCADAIRATIPQDKR